MYGFVDNRGLPSNPPSVFAPVVMLPPTKLALSRSTSAGVLIFLATILSRNPGAYCSICLSMEAHSADASYCSERFPVYPAGT